MALIGIRRVAGGDIFVFFRYFQKISYIFLSMCGEQQQQLLLGVPTSFPFEIPLSSQYYMHKKPKKYFPEACWAEKSRGARVSLPILRGPPLFLLSWVPKEVGKRFKCFSSYLFSLA